MIRALLVASTIAVTIISTAPSASADSDVPGMDYNASSKQPCSNWKRYIFGRGPHGETLACVVASNGSGVWVDAAPLQGVRQIGSPCLADTAGTHGGSAQSPDGLPLLCDDVGNQWVPGP